MNAELLEAAPHRSWTQFLPDFRLGFDNLLLHKLRSLLTMLGMIFGVAAVVAMLSIGAGAQKQVMAFIEQLGVHNLLVEAKEANDEQTFQKTRQTSPGLTFQDLRIIQANVPGILESTARKKFVPSKMVPKPAGEVPALYGVNALYPRIAGLSLVEGRFFDDADAARSAPVCVLGEGAKASLFGPREALGQYVKAGDQWFHVIGVAGPRLTAQAAVPNLAEQDLNNLVYVPLGAALFRLADSQSRYKDEIDGIELALEPSRDSVAAANLVRGLLNATHHQAGDFSVIVPAELLAQQRSTERIFNVVMVAIASISLLVGGIGIMNIMLAGILERTREIGVRRAVGARQGDIVRQFVIEAMMISWLGGLIGLVFGFGLSRTIAWLAGWSTIVTLSSILLAFLVSVSVGLVFGIYPAFKAARLDPIEALRYE